MKDWRDMHRREFMAALSAAFGGAACAWAAPRSWFLDYAGSKPVERLVNTWCPMCPGGCGLTVRVVHGCAVGVRGNADHPINRGGLCSRASAVLQDVYNPDRLRRPLRRAGQRGEGRWEETDWDTAIRMIVEKLIDIRENAGPHHLCVAMGRDRGLTSMSWRRLARAYGTPNFIEVFPEDNLGVLPAVLATHGVPQRIGYDVAAASFVLSFSSAWLDAHWSTEQAARGFADFRRGRPGFRPRWVHVEPRYSLTAAKADEWLPLRPGTEGALALGIAHVLIREGLYDRQFVQRHGFGFDDWTDADGHKHLGFRRMVLQDFAPSKIQALTGVPEGAIFRLAREFGMNKPALALAYDGGGCSAVATYDRMAIHCLNALVGSIDVPGGITVFQEFALLEDEDLPIDEAARRGLSQPRLDGPAARRRLCDHAVDLLADAITQGQPYRPEALFIVDADPVFDLAEGARFESALSSVPFVVAFAAYPDDTTRQADLIIPSLHGLHRWDFNAAHTLTGQPVVTLAQPVLDPPEGMRDSYGLLRSVAQALGGPVAEALPWSNSAEAVNALCRELFEQGSGATFGPANEESWARLLESRGWRAPFAKDYQTFKKDMLAGGGWTDPIYFHREWDRVFRSPARRFAFSSVYLARSFEALRDPNDAVDHERRCLPNCRTDRPSVNPHFPLQLYVYALPNLVSVSSPNLPWLNDIAGAYMFEKWRTWVEISPQTAERNGIAEGDRVRVQTSRGELTLPAKLYAGIQPEVIAIPFGFGHKSGGRWCEDIGANPAALVEPQTDPLTGKSLWTHTRASIEKIMA